MLRLIDDGADGRPRSPLRRDSAAPTIRSTSGGDDNVRTSSPRRSNVDRTTDGIPPRRWLRPFLAPPREPTARADWRPVEGV
ncbi:hypothetical protein DV707_16135 (plasmid) [Halobellus limi]|uniref:Uncharacterized protein n=1 Tax=Halobellus limi TaxID=699433 RepID=A0A4D6H5Q9_9EURY|nr:hypothetical protein DV707_16135 [Halobellus limi]